MAYQDVILASTPLRYWPLNEVSGTSANELVANEDATAVGMALGGAAGPDGIGGVCPLFTGTASEYITLRAAALLGGLAEWTIEVWGYYTPVGSSDVRVLYGEQGTAGNDAVIAIAKGSGSSAQLRHTYGHDGASATNDSNGIALSSRWVLYHFTRAADGVVTASWQAGQRLSASGSTTNTWTNAGVEARLGLTPRGASPWRGRIAQCAVYNRVLTKAERVAHYETGSPLTRVLVTGDLWTPESHWNQLLTDVGDVPTIAADSAATAAKLVAQVTAHTAAAQTGGGPVFMVDNTTPTQRVRLEGGAAGNPSTDKPYLYDAMADVPIPADFEPGLGSTDVQATIVNTVTGKLWEFWLMQQTLLRPEYVDAVALGVGTIPAGSYYYAIAGRDGSALHGAALQEGPVAVSGSQGVQVTWGTVESAVSYEVWRHITGDPNWHVIAVVSSATHSFVDDGSFAEGTGFPSSAPTSVTTDWGAAYAGYIANRAVSPGVYLTPRANWGATATSLPLLGGVITLEEGMARDIPHALTMALPQTTNSHVYPAQRHDYSGGTHAIAEGTRFQLDPAYDVNLIVNPFARAVAVAFQSYGGYIRDFSPAVTVCYVEDDRKTGRSFQPALFDGKHAYELFTNATFPFDQMRVIDPAWTQAHAQEVPVPLPASVGAYWGVRI